MGKLPEPPAIILRRANHGAEQVRDARFKIDTNLAGDLRGFGQGAVTTRLNLYVFEQELVFYRDGDLVGDG